MIATKHIGKSQGISTLQQKKWANLSLQDILGEEVNTPYRTQLIDINKQDIFRKSQEILPLQQIINWLTLVCRIYWGGELNTPNQTQLIDTNKT